MSKLVVAEQGPGKNVKSADESIYVKKTETKQQLCVQAVWQSDKSRMKMIAAIFYDADFNEPQYTYLDSKLLAPVTFFAKPSS